MNRKVLIIIGVAAILLLIILVVSNITGNVITGFIVDESVENKYFKIGSNGEINGEVVNESQNRSRQG